MLKSNSIFLCLNHFMFILKMCKWRFKYVKMNVELISNLLDCCQKVGNLLNRDYFFDATLQPCM